MLDIQKFYIDAEAGNKINSKEVIEYLKSFKNIIIWGAGNLGTALGRNLIREGVEISGYWDQKFETLKTCNGVPVYPSFDDSFIQEKENTLVICSIVNGTQSNKGQAEALQMRGYFNYLYGMQLYEGIVCSIGKDRPLDVKQCTSTNICNFNTCKKYINILKSMQEKKEIVIPVLEFVISRRCTIDCMECGQRVGIIKRKFPEKYYDYPLERIKKDIDLVMDSVDIVGTFSIIGGEPFIHPDIIDIIEYCLSKKNVAIISVTTNGICKMSEEMLLRIKSDRVKLNFSNYTKSLSVEQKKIFRSNVDLVKKCGVNCNIATPVWSHVVDMIDIDPDIPESHYLNTKKNCQFGPSVSNGTFFACPVTELYDKLEEVDVSEDQVRLDENKKEQLRDDISKLLNKPFYETCRHRCGNRRIGEQVKAGVQCDRL